ncbi:Glycosyl transferase group 1 [Paraburkholderia ribeironis]|uniref:Glycosyl transferase group 1 n=1 Tax=Paraburkholderia ribeironis TaxID=1247936 RepID=A0A1N7RME3_9BURK|nr:glycosyltransferase [Paraburkholderia ribeironis]SIT36294.1 Glycosyl transferase group 1 [Paraburkholderia ribeironis]
MTLRVCAPDIFSGDAVGNHCLGIARAASRLGLAAELYAQFYDVGMSGVRPLEELFATVAEDDVVLLSYSIFDPYLERLLALNCRKICYFHGVTDPQLLRELEPPTARLCELALAQLPLLAGFDVVVANSHSTAASLAGMLDVAAVKVIPPVFADMPVFQREAAAAGASSREPNLLMVGRVVPHKRIEDGIDILALLKQRELDATLTIVGGSPNYEYQKLLINHARRLGVLERVDFKGTLDDADLFDCYDATSALLAMSRHEGFCVPVLEAMHFGKPVFVRGGTAAQELCLPDWVFAPEADLSVWALAIANRLSKSAAGNRIDSAYVAHANEILQRTSDSAWQDLLVEADAQRSNA